MRWPPRWSGVVVGAALLAWGYPESPRFTTSEPSVSLQPQPWLLTLPGAPARALELAGSTMFVKAPWQVDLVSYNTTVGQPLPEYYFTLNLDPEAGASLAGFTFQQIRGVDRQFPFLLERTRAFLGRPRREGRPVPVKAHFNNGTRTMTLEFPEPIQPGSTVTVSVVPWTNPIQSDTYLFQVVAYPAGPDPLGSPVGVGTLRIYESTYW
jgi:hypothetical protein